MTDKIAITVVSDTMVGSPSMQNRSKEKFPSETKTSLNFAEIKEWMGALWLPTYLPW
jgi:hypothetical protein